KIAHFDGTDFTIQFSVPDVPIYDLFGQGDDHVWAVTGWNHPPPISYLAEYTNGAWQTVYQVEGIGDSLGYWYYGCAIGDSLYLSSYGGIIKRSILTGEVNLIPTAVIEDEPWKLGRVRGTGPNDLMVQATDATLRHWNGASWQVAINLQSYYTSYMGNFKLTHDYFVGVGNMQSGGFVIKALR
ncbi:MAG: hypothetical protein K9M19_05610, partial [Candidatus Marinimicrobia bacterium]|nr:hypothetical protein [Candidatus Neomarinimicrobiota bacterium]